MAEHEEATPQAEPRRRRRRAAGLPFQAEPRDAGAELGSALEERPVPARWQRGRLHWLSSLGLSPTFRIYIFLGSILALIAFLLYSESLIREAKEQERNRVYLFARLHAFAVSPQASGEQAAFIFQEVINNPNSDFPIIVTTHRGEITDWRGGDLPAPGDLSPESRGLLQEAMEVMDASNPPVAFTYHSEAVGYCYWDEDRFIITDNAEELEKRTLVEWVGRELPARGDTSAAARTQVLDMARRLEAAGRRGTFRVSTEDYSHLYYGAAGFVVADPKGIPRAWAGRDLPAQGDTSAAALARVEAVRRQLALLNERQDFKIPAERYIHYGDSALVQRVSQAPVWLIGAVLLFALVGYIGLRNIRRSEQRSIWVGMAKETAHQLGTPLSSLSGWLELMRGELASAVVAGERERAARLDQMLGEMYKDLGRLTRIASRFSQIGSVPELKPGDVQAVLMETVNYFKSRGPQFGRHQIEVAFGELVPVPLNAELLSWALENLFKNAVDAMGGKAGIIRIRAGLRPEGDMVQISFQDEGRGIAPENIERVFQPGFSTKKRGWGLGLTFVRRIVEEYHKGKISIVHSAPGEGTTFELLLPVK
ncbi:MAG: HAMP domain-containing histidine kinase [Candidatus Latescibacteria bacterium]|nr:HAMP domain-containing histidine kinase [Candidatus Latescibacterota bacterium]